jgi:hypothetical protein
MSENYKVLLNEGGGITFWCPGCDGAHAIQHGEGAGPRWGWNGSIENPTLTPSVKVTWPANPNASEEFKEWRTERICHLKWQPEWNARDTRDAEAKAHNDAAGRDKEPARQQSINNAIQNGRQIIDQATADAATARLAASEARGNCCTTAASQAAARYAAVLAHVFKRADQRAGDLAEVADRARARGVTCEQTYDGVV